MYLIVSDPQVFLFDVTTKLVFAVVFLVAVFREGADIGLVLHMSSLMVVAVADCGELLWAELALIWSDTRVDSLVNLEITPLVELLGAWNWITNSLVFSEVPPADELLANLVLILSRLRVLLLLV